MHHLYEGVQWQCHSQAQAAAWPLRAQAAAQAAAQLVQDRGGGSIFSVEAAEATRARRGLGEDSQDTLESQGGMNGDSIFSIGI